jgi:hypothetical protein
MAANLFIYANLKILSLLVTHQGKLGTGEISDKVRGGKWANANFSKILLLRKILLP